jgi:DNA-binding transcriptional regulator YiaG
MTPSHVAVKMGIATSSVCSWEAGTSQPNDQQLKVLSSIFGFNAKVFETLASNLLNLSFLALENQA